MKQSNNKISFILGNEIIKIDFQEGKYSTTTTVLEYLRTLPERKGVKEGCAEGDCGACTIVMAELKNNKLEYKAVNSCLLLLPSIHGKQIITVEDLGTSTNMHVIQKAILDYNGSQCGFCTPGFIMSLFGLFKNEQNSTDDEIIESITGNLCRCTGYRPIADAAKHVFANKQNDQFTQNEPKIIKLIKEIQQDNLKLAGIIKLSDKFMQQYFIPQTLEQFFDIHNQFPEAELINGSTDTSLRITKNKEQIKQIIDLSQINDLQNIIEDKDENVFKIGAGVTMEDLRQNIKNKLPALYKMLSVFGAKQIRNKATIGGNVATASPIGDIVMTLIAYNAKIIIRNAKNERVIPLNKFITGYRQTLLEKNEIVRTIIIPKPSENEIIKSYKISKRSHLDISTVSAAFNLQLSNDNKIQNIIIVYGGMAAMPMRATKTELFLKDKDWTNETIIKSQEILSNEFTPLSDARSGKVARTIMCKNLLMKFFSENKNK